MRRGRRGRPHLLCPPCPPIGRSGGQGAETSSGVETSPGAEPGCSRLGKAAHGLRGRCAGQPSSSGCQPRARRCHGRPAPALRAPSGTEEFGHRSARGSRSQDRCRQAVLGRGSGLSAKPVSSLRLRGVSTVQCNRLCVPSLCFNQSHREPKQRRRHYVARLLGGVRPVRAGRVLQRSTPVLVPFLLRGQASRGRGQHRERIQWASSGRGSRNNPGRQSKRDPAPEGQVKGSPRLYAQLPAGELGSTSQPKASTDSSAYSRVESSTRPSSPSKPAPGSSSRTTLGQSPLRSPASASQLPGKSRGQPRSRANSSNQPPQAASPQHLQSSVTSSGQPQPARESSGSVLRPSTTSSQAPPVVQSPSGSTIPTQPLNKTSDGPEDPAPKASKSSGQQEKGSSAQPNSSSSGTDLPVSCPSESSLEYSSESTTEVTCRWPHRRHELRYLQHCWRLKHLAC
ncbi:receptor expression-enhancing protein 6 isoform X1 [Ursus americanus]|uniref:receptor expression-enhancing protein 6 isoform X1 n=1 Tax=Ursus americanus TaxID=9643 RepID=UPI001E67B546|nr:receptor expression-enhancing protein 6 isoform X1 [Ursus americanus]